MTRREIMVKAHEYAKQIVGNYAAAMSYGLKKAWSESKLPVLVGSEKQIAWATDIRNSNIREIKREICYFERMLAEKSWDQGVTILAKLNVFIDKVNNENVLTAAKYWIDHKNLSGWYIQKIKQN